MKAFTFIAAAAMASSFGAQAVAQATGPFTLELNNTADVEQSCRLTYVATNGMGIDLSEASYEVAVFDSDGLVERLLILQFGALADGRTKVVQFDLADTACSGISRLLVNSVSECAAADGSAPDCLDALETTSRSDINFGL
ncbi:MAG: hypothetical protein AAGB05_00150 [Pseudomonadota bacterium]